MQQKIVIFLKFINIALNVLLYQEPKCYITLLTKAKHPSLNEKDALCLIEVALYDFLNDKVLLQTELELTETLDEMCYSRTPQL
ncbi:hypothetical protein D7Z54_22385 [Salibacterium salarium]|uniref:Uncharacterized protein n=1 Tax=Salibacterium salarium TaxID=284579 RepID=A0A428MY55_9BACI|nr:hypothetical protein D7Z54_22385 [Salibacterium salarium]